MITMNRPKVTRIAGNAKITRIGFTIILIMARINPAITMSLKRSLYVILLLRNPEAIHSPSPHTTQRVRKRMSGRFMTTYCRLAESPRQLVCHYSYAGFRNKHIVFNANAYSFSCNVDTRFYSHHNTWLKWSIIVSDVVSI